MCSATAASCGTALSMLQISRAKRTRASRSMLATISSVEAIVALAVGCASAREIEYSAAYRDCLRLWGERTRRRKRISRELVRQVDRKVLSSRDLFSAACLPGTFLALRNVDRTEGRDHGNIQGP